MSESSNRALALWAQLAPVGFRRLEDLCELPRAEQGQVLEAWVAWLHSKDNPDATVRSFQRLVSQLLQEFDSDQTPGFEAGELERKVNNWLETAGEVGGPEQEQDPTRSHPALWHSARSRNSSTSD
jgi:hypothetical protein